MLAAIDWIEVSFLLLVGSMVVLAGLFSLYVVLGLFRNTGFRRRGSA